MVRKPMGLRIHKTSLMVTHIDSNSPLFGKVYVGDRLWAAENKRILKHEQLEEILKNHKGDEPNKLTLKAVEGSARRITGFNSAKIKVDFKHGSFSWCKHKCTTVERMHLDKDTEKITGRAIEIYCIFIRFQTAMDDRSCQFGVAVKYDARERLKVVSVEPGSMGAIHIRPGDIIREVNDKSVVSKAMLQYYVNESVMTSGLVKITVECPAGGDDAYRDSVEMAGDVIDIAAKQIERFKTKDRFILPKPCIRAPVKCVKGQKRKEVTISTQERTEVLIAADHDPTKLKSCKTARQ